jgi:peptide/nickel transport system permease protein
VTVVAATGAATRPRRGSPLNLRLGIVLAGGLAAFAVAAVVGAGDGHLIVAAQRLQPPSAAHWFGTDDVGRDVLARALAGLRLSLLIAAGTTVLLGAVGVPAGLVAGWVRGRPHEIIGRVLDMAMSIPPLIFVLLVVNITGFGVSRMAVAIALSSAPAVARVLRAEAQRIRESDFVQAATARGERIGYLLSRELLPNLLPLIAVELTYRFGVIVTMAGALSFFGLGVQPPRADLGLMIAQAKPFLPVAPTMVFLPGLVMVAVVLAANLLGDGLRDHLTRRTGRS